ncbi:unnamed protein product [Caenorhabditis bovis]|uniref:Uncharacterized protein n=1 Tax=Caenorhabditis bovis TaxID=2654633 RepID=A0A8S1EAV0_9PELO|nr:unnamed protein product [Caenorhabditis bovis]
MLRVAVISWLALSCAARPQDVANNRVVVLSPNDDADAIHVDAALAAPLEDVAYAYAVDFAVPASLPQLQCLKSARYATVFVRGFNPAGKGSFDANSVTTIRNAYSAGLGIEVYVTPQPASKLTGAQQLDAVYQGLTKNSIVVRSMWLQVTSPANWPGSVSSHVNFISSFVSGAKKYGLTVGIYTNQYDWSQITGNWKSLDRNTLLWYWHVLGGGVTGETTPTFDDFRPFGPFAHPSVKQFAQVETICQLTVNRNVYAVGIPEFVGGERISKSSNIVKSGGDEIVVGTIGI